MNSLISRYKTLALALGVAALAAFTSCSNDDFTYQDVPTARLVADENWTLGTDSATVSFVTITDNEQKIKVDAYVTGSVSNTDRTVNLSVVAEKTTAAAALYDVPASVVIPAGQNKGTFEVCLRKDASLSTKAVRLTIRQVASADFEVGVADQNSVTFIWSDMISKPLYWDDIKEHFGEYSDAKYRFMLLTLVEKGYSSNLDPATGLNWSDYHNYNIIFGNSLAEYNATHATPLTDENGSVVTF